jgi:tetratricopeptide (TPR) repeat protein
MNRYLVLFLMSIFALAPVNTIWGTLSAKRISEAYYKSYNYEKMGNYNDAIKALKLVHKKYPKGYTVNYRLGYLYNVNKQYANAKSHFKKAILTSRYSIEPKLGLMLVQMTKGDYKDAEEIGHQILSTDYYNYYANLRLAYVLRKQNKAELAEKTVLKMLSLYPIDIYFLLEYGILKMNSSDYTTAKTVFGDVLILDPENVLANQFLIEIGDKKTAPSKSSKKSKKRAGK